MFSLLYGVWTLITFKRELKFLILGIDNAGKTTTLECIKKLYMSKTPRIPLDRIKPTIGLNLCHVDFDKTFSGVFWDLGGQLMLRSIWENHYRECDGLLYIVDSTDAQRFTDVASTLQAVVNHSALRGRSLPVALFINKQDAKQRCVPLNQVIQMLGLEHCLAYAKIIQYPCATLQPTPHFETFSLASKTALTKRSENSPRRAVSKIQDVTPKRNLSSPSMLSLSTPTSFSDPPQVTSLSFGPLMISENYARIICIVACCATKSINIQPALNLLIEEAKALRKAQTSC